MKWSGKSKNRFLKERTKIPQKRTMKGLDILILSLLKRFNVFLLYFFAKHKSLFKLYFCIGANKFQDYLEQYEIDTMPYY